MGKVANKLIGVAFWGIGGLVLVYSGATMISNTALDSAESISGLGFMLMGGLGLIKALLIGTRS